MFGDAFVDVRGVQTTDRRYDIRTSFLDPRTAVASFPIESHEIECPEAENRLMSVVLDR